MAYRQPYLEVDLVFRVIGYKDNPTLDPLDDDKVSGPVVLREEKLNGLRLSEAIKKLAEQVNN